MLNKVNKEVLSFLFKGELPNKNATQVSAAREPQREKVQLTKEDYKNRPQQTNTNQQQERQPVETFVRTERKIGRNDRVTIKNVMSGENKEVKYKQALPLLEKGQWVLTED